MLRQKMLPPKKLQRGAQTLIVFVQHTCERSPTPTQSASLVQRHVKMSVVPSPSSSTPLQHSLPEPNGVQSLSEQSTRESQSLSRPSVH